MATSSQKGAPVIVLLGPVGVGKSLLATALAGLQQSNEVFKVGDSAQAVTLEATCHRTRWFGRSSEEELILVDPPGVGDGDADAARLAQVVRVLRDFGYVSLFLVVLNSEQPRIGSVLENLLRLMEECFGRRFWRHVVLVFTRFYTDPRSARRRGNKTREMMREEFSALLSAQFPRALEERVPSGEPFPSYFVDSEAAINGDLPDAERNAVFLELERLSVFARSSPPLSTTAERNTSASAGSQISSGASDAGMTEHQDPAPEDVFECQEFSTGAWVQVHGLVATPSLNGAQGLIVEFQASRGRYVVELVDGSRKMIHAKNLKLAEVKGIPAGSTALIVGLSGATQLNGQACKVKSAKEGRYMVQVPDGSVKSVKLQNLQVLPAAAEQVTASNIVEGALVERGAGWIWEDQDGGDGCVGRLGSCDSGWATVLWRCGRKNVYRIIGAVGRHDLRYVDAFEHEVACLKAVQQGKSGIRTEHLHCTFAYPCGPKMSHVSFFDVRDEVCKAIGGFAHGQQVRVTSGLYAVAIGVQSDEGHPRMFFHVDGSEGAGMFRDGQKLVASGRRVVREAARPPSGLDNKELLELSKDVAPSFQYVDGPNSYESVSLEHFDIRDEICTKVGKGLKHGEVVKLGRSKTAVVIGVRANRQIPKLFFHVDGSPGAGTFEEWDQQSFQVVGHRQVQETPDSFLEEPPLSPEAQELAGCLQCTFNFPAGLHDPNPAKFDIRENVCRAVGGFTHGQVLTDHDGDEAVVVGVKMNDGVPKLWFKFEKGQGAGLYSRYHLISKEFKVVGKRKLQEVPSSDPMYENNDGQQTLKSMLELLERRLRKARSRSQELEQLDPDFAFDFTFRYLQKDGESALFDIRDDVCLAVGGFRHGDVLCHQVLGQKTSLVIGVRPDNEGVPKLWMHCDGSLGAGVFEDQDLVRMTSSVKYRKEVPELPLDAEHAFSDEFIAGLQCTFHYPIGLGRRVRPGLFDVRDEVCLKVGGCKHGQRLKYNKLELVVIGVTLDEGRPKVFLQVVKPHWRPGAGMVPNLHLMKLKELGMQTVEEVMPSGSDHQDSGVESRESTGIDPADSAAEHSSSESTPEHPKSSDAEGAMKSTPPGGQALVLRLSHCNAQVKNMLLTSPELEDCREDVRKAGCEVTPDWAHGAVLLVPLQPAQAEALQLELRAHHVLAFPGDKDRVLKALSALPCRRRPRLRGEYESGPVASAVEVDAEDAKEETEEAWQADGSKLEGLVLRVDRTFLTLDAASDAGTFSNETAPCGESTSKQPVNPRKWR